MNDLRVVDVCADRPFQPVIAVEAAAVSPICTSHGHTASMLASIDTARVVRGVLADTRSSPVSTTSTSSARAPQAYIQGRTTRRYIVAAPTASAALAAHRPMLLMQAMLGTARGRDIGAKVLNRARPYHDLAGAVDAQIVQRLLRA